MVIQHNYLGKIEELMLPEKSVGSLLSNCQPTGSLQVANSQLRNGNCWLTKDHQSADSFPIFFAGEQQMADRFLGKLVSILPLFRLFIGS